MKALTVCQPYAELIACGEKWVENRRWPTSYRGPLAIHAGKSRTWLGPTDESLYHNMAFGAIVAVCRLDACVRFNSITGSHDPKMIELAAHEHTEGPWCWVLRDVRRITPVPCRGAQGLWNVPNDLELFPAAGGEE